MELTDKSRPWEQQREEDGRFAPPPPNLVVGYTARTDKQGSPIQRTKSPDLLSPGPVKFSEKYSIPRIALLVGFVVLIVLGVYYFLVL